MKTIIILIIIALSALYFSSKLKKNGSKYDGIFASWATSLLFFNIMIALFFYFFNHQVKKKEGEIGLKGKLGPRGYEGRSELCKFKCD